MATVQKTLKALRAHLADEHAKNSDGVTNPDVWVSQRFKEWAKFNGSRFDAQCTDSVSGSGHGLLSFREIQPAFLSLIPTYRFGSYPKGTILLVHFADGAKVRKVGEQEAEVGFVLPNPDFWKNYDFWQGAEWVCRHHGELLLYRFTEGEMIFLPQTEAGAFEAKLQFDV